MHERWAQGGENSYSIPQFPHGELASVDDVFISLVNVLLNTHSVETTVAALEGIHSFVAQKPSIISRLFSEVSGEWPQKWLLSAAESWAVLHPQEIAQLKEIFVQFMEFGELACRLQSWLVLVRNAKTLGLKEPAFPIPEEPRLSEEEVKAADTILLEIPSEHQGSTHFANKFSSVHMLLQYCKVLGFGFDFLNGIIAKELATTQSHDVALLKRGPHRHADYVFNTADADRAFGNALSGVISGEWCKQEDLKHLCQAILPAEDAWIHRFRPRAIQYFEDWPAESEYGGEKVPQSKRRKQMLDAARDASVDEGWQVFCARVRDYTHSEDFDLHLWFESDEEPLLITEAIPPKTLTGRSFVWCNQAPLKLSQASTVSGLFAAGHQRLSFCHFEIQPSPEWQAEFGWIQNPQNPLEWLFDSEPVARYERVHGVLRTFPMVQNTVSQLLIDG